MLSEEQKAEVAKWFAAGASLDEIQKRLKSECGVHITYLDLRLLVADLPQPAEAAPETDEEAAPPEEGVAEPPKRYDLDAPDADGGEPTADVAVEVDALTIPGTLASGAVTFSDGTKAKWYLDQLGRLDFDGAPQGYRPSPGDAALFRARLVEALRARGLA